MNENPSDPNNKDESAPSPSERIGTITSWEDLSRVPNLVTEIDEANLKTLARIVGQYAMRDKKKRPCSIRQCHTPHFNGRIIRFNDGKLSYIGQRCGQTIFGEQWTRAVEAYDAVVARERRIEQFEQMKNDAHQVLAELELRKEKLARIDRAMDSLYRVVNPHIMRDVERRAASENDSDITVAHRLSEDDKEFARATGQNLAGITTVIGTLHGLRIFRTGYRPVSVANSLKTACKVVLSLSDPFSSSFKSVSAQATALRRGLRKLDQCLAAGEAFLKPENLNLLTKLQLARETKLRALSISPEGTVTAS